MIGSANDAINPGCEDLAPAYQAGVAAYQQRNATCDAIDRVAHPIKRTSVRGQGQVGRAQGVPLHGQGDPRCAGTVADHRPDRGQQRLGVDRRGERRRPTWSRSIPPPALGVGLGAATLAFPPTRAATMVVGSGITGVLGKLVNVVKAPFVAVARSVS